ncbi:uncharacterized protein TM35_000191030 [Trypanosoma theileri]|uniref:Transcription factor-like protein n=1 Tax=Trypanosoma theileri TaxID=67003 RepID=A0A1X0NUI9_9TRYP|nr:uncharacterized protein TM35_000191030 [Trypanosoma theileri]ORC87859.1 hypothetical protein TM35_000191030 [Trypanosoma theileri]
MPKDIVASAQCDSALLPERTKDIIQQLVSLRYECASCLNNIRHDVAVWSCDDCFRIFHLYCIKKWAKQGESGDGLSFRCPHCQKTHSSASKYVCFCGKMRDPPYDPHITPHSCGQTCGKARPFCPHPCPLQCHPGPCPDCSAIAGPQTCSCGATTYTWRCGNPDPQKTCQGICSKELNCGKHKCKRTCHLGPCDPCSEKVQVICYCSSETRELLCPESSFSCGKVCGKKLRCGVHFCDLECHSGSCPPCSRDPSVVSTCPCGTIPLTIERLKCDDPIPTCTNVCGRLLDCGRHACEKLCHDGDCEPCKHRSLTRCLCGMTQVSLPCKDQDGFRCEKVCKTKLSCGKHECRETCCSARKKPNDVKHNCNRVCNRKLACGHECLEPCHRGLCPPCAHVVPEILKCRCGAEMLMPPQPCGTPPPKCNRPCTIVPPCNHPPSKHSCHYGDCPPCMFPVKMMCAGGHTIVGNIPCSAEFASCKKKCGKLLACGHECMRMCHPGLCIDESHVCVQICGKIHEECGHVCKSKCHFSQECPQCQEVVERRCECGRKIEHVPCKKFLKFLNEHPEDNLDLKCNADCLFEQRLQILASRIKTPLPSSVRYSIPLWSFALQNSEWIRTIEEQLSSFITSDSSMKCMKPMPSEKRAIVHSLCHFYHLRSEAVDSEPNRSCILTKTPMTRIPVPLLSEAITEPDRYNPIIFIKEISERDDMLCKRVIVMKGQHVNIVSVSRSLQDYAGDFVCETEDILSNGVKQIRTFFINEAKRQQAYRHLRAISPPFDFFIPTVSNDRGFKETKPPSLKSWVKTVSSK